jgi:Protein of unknown function (DUF3140)
MASALEQKDIRDRFKQAVNMSPTALRKWLDSPESRAVGWKGEDGDGPGESVGHASGRHILRIKAKKIADFTDDDYAHMQKVVGYVARHSKQRPAEPDHSRWRYSLMNWGHDPMI